MSISFLKARQALLFAVLSLSLFIASTRRAAAYDAFDQRAVERADNYLGRQETGEGVLNFFHMGAAYRGHSYLRTIPVVDSDGDLVPGHFALVYRFRWEDDGITDIAFLCNEHGSIYRVQVAYTNAVLNQPFLVANATIQVLGNLVIDNYKKGMSPGQLRLAHELVDHADAKGLLELALALSQSAHD